MGIRAPTCQEWDELRCPPDVADPRYQAAARSPRRQRGFPWLATDSGKLSGHRQPHAHDSASGCRLEFGKSFSVRCGRHVGNRPLLGLGSLVLIDQDHDSSARTLGHGTNREVDLVEAELMGFRYEQGTGIHQ